MEDLYARRRRYSGKWSLASKEKNEKPGVSRARVAGQE